MYSISLLYKTLRSIRPSLCKGLSTWGRFKGKLRQSVLRDKGMEGATALRNPGGQYSQMGFDSNRCYRLLWRSGDWEREAEARDAFGHRKMKRNFFSAFFRLEIFPRGCKNWNSLLLQLGKSEKIKYSSARGVELFHRNKCTRTLEDYLRDAKNKCLYYCNFLFF